MSGIIELSSTLEITEPFLTLAGQSAPGDGICLRGHGVVVANTHDVIIRYLRVRPGDIAKKETDALSVYKSQNVIIDHCSASWGTDETISVTGEGTSEVTVQWCMITESLNHSVHSKGAHGYGSLLRADGRVTFHHNLYAHHSSRNPRPGTYGDMNRGLLLDFRNNVIYDWGERAGYTAADKASINYIANYLKPGSSTNPGVRDYAFHIGGSTTTLFADLNRIENLPEKDSANWAMIELPKGVPMADVRLPGQLAAAPVTTQSAQAAYELVLRAAGATRPGGRCRRHEDYEPGAQRDRPYHRFPTGCRRMAGVSGGNAGGGWRQRRYARRLGAEERLETRRGRRQRGRRRRRIHKPGRVPQQPAVTRDTRTNTDWHGPKR